MLELIGSNYVIEHVIAEYRLRIQEKIYQIYTGDLLKAIAEFTGCDVQYRFAELIDTDELTRDGRSGDEIALDVILSAGLKVKGNDDESV